MDKSMDKIITFVKEPKNSVKTNNNGNPATYNYTYGKFFKVCPKNDEFLLTIFFSC